MRGHRKVWWNNIVYYFLMMSWAAVGRGKVHRRRLALRSDDGYFQLSFCHILFAAFPQFQMNAIEREWIGERRTGREETKEYNVFCVMVLGRFHTFVPNSNSKSDLFMPIWTCRVCASCYRIWFGYAYLAHLSIHAETIRTMHGTAVHCPNEWIANASERCVSVAVCVLTEQPPFGLCLPLT